MSQLSFFGRAEVAAMRNRSAARNHSPRRDAFRREHQRRRAHGKAQRHAERIYRAFQETCSDEVPTIPPSGTPAAPTRRGPVEIRRLAAR